MISICMLTKNAAATLAATLDSVKTFPEVILLDTGSTDQTLAIAQKYPNVKIFHTAFTGFGDLRNQAAELAQHDWIFALDSDEVVSAELLEELAGLCLDPGVAYKIPRHNFYRGKRIRGCGWDPESVARLYHRGKVRFVPLQVHESLEAGASSVLRAPLLHTPYRSTQDFLAKMQHYSTLFAEEYRGKRKSSFAKAFFHGFFAFVRSYVVRRGFLDGEEGFIISLYNANTTFYKYLKLKEINTTGRLIE